MAPTNGLPINNSIGKPYRPDNPSSLNTPLYDLLIHNILHLVIGNPWPAIVQQPLDTSKWLNNVLLDACRKNETHAETLNEALSHDNNIDRNIGRSGTSDEGIPV